MESAEKFAAVVIFMGVALAIIVFLIFFACCQIFYRIVSTSFSPFS